MNDLADDLIHELNIALTKFPTWPTDPIHAAAAVFEEAGELQKAVLQATYEPDKSGSEEVRDEALQLTCMAIRFLHSLDQYQYKPSEQHVQEYNDGI